MAKKNNTKSLEKQSTETKEDDEISFDFSKIKNIFKKKHKQTASSHQADTHRSHPKKEDDDEESINLNLGSVSSFFKKYSVVFLLLIPIILALIFRSYPADLPITEDWARASINNQIRNAITQQINQQYPNLPDSNKNLLVDQQFNEYVKANKAQIDEQVKSGADYLRSQFQDENDYTYLGDIDSYYYARQARNIVEKGTICDKIIEGECIDDHMVAPTDIARASVSLHPYAIAFAYKIGKIFKPNFTFLRAAFYLPYLLSVLTIIIAFFTAKEVAGNVGGFFAGMIVAAQPLFLTRTFGSDTDIWNVFFPLLVTFLALKALDSKNMKPKIIYSVLAGLSVGIFSFAWVGWWYIFDFVVGAMVIYLIIDLIMNYKYLGDFKKLIEKSLVKETFIVIMLFSISSAIFVAIIQKNIFTIWDNAVMGPLGFLFIKDAVAQNFFPNVYTTVAELNPGNMDQVISSLGGLLFFWISIFGVFLTVTRKDNKGRRNIIYFLLFSMWYFGTIFATLKGIRFLLLLVPAFAVSFGIAIGILYQFVSRWMEKELEMNAILSKTIVLLILLLLLVQPIRSSEAASKNEIPMINDGWYDTLTKIKEQSAKDAIITSWWDFGHHFKYLADRRVTFDGASQTPFNAHWVGKILLTDDEDLAVGLLRMLDCSGGEKAYYLINAEFNDVHRSVGFINQIAVLNKEDAKTLMDQNFDAQTSNELIEMTHCAPPEAYFITSEDMVGKAGVWAHFGSWDFQKSEIWLSYKDLPETEFVQKLEEQGFDKENATRLYFEVQSIPDEASANTWISPWPSYLSGETPCIKQDNETLICQNGLTINLTNYDVTVPTSQGVLAPRSFSYVENNEFHLSQNNKGKVLTTQDGSFIGATLMGQNGDYRTILMSDALTGSMFTRMFFHEGLGLDYFEKYSDITDVTGSRIIVWKVNWEGK